MEGGHYVYLVECHNGTLYTGYSTNVIARVKKHNQGRGAKYTRNNRPVVLVGTLSFDTQSEALRAERAIKRLPPDRKRALFEVEGGTEPEK